MFIYVVHALKFVMVKGQTATSLYLFKHDSISQWLWQQGCSALESMTAECAPHPASHHSSPEHPTAFVRLIIMPGLICSKLRWRLWDLSLMLSLEFCTSE